MSNQATRIQVADQREGAKEANAIGRREQQQQPQQNKITTTKKTTTVQTTTSINTTSSNNHLKVGPTNPIEPTTERLSMALVEDLGKQAAQIDSTASIRRNLSSSGSNNKSKQRSADQTNDLRLPSIQEDILRSNGEHSRDERVDGNKVVTTISTVAAQSGQSRIVIALLKDGQNVQLKIQEMRPGMLEVGANYKECLRYFEEHQKLVRNLRKLEKTPIDGWMEKFNKKVSVDEPIMSTERRLVYMCMVENLQGCWRALLNQLDGRSGLLEETCRFYESAELLVRALDRADHHVQVFRQEFLDGSNSIRFQQASNELKNLNRNILELYNEAKLNQQRLIDLISLIGTGNLGDARVNYLISSAQSLINYISAYLDPLARRKIQLESVITTTTTRSSTTTTTINDLQSTRSNQQQSFNDVNNSDNSIDQSSNKATMSYIREINNFNDLNLVENWLNVKTEQLNSSLLSSLGMSVSDSRSILGKHEQIALECRAIEEATLTFNGRNIHAIKSVDQKDDKYQGDKSLFEHQKQLATRARDVITILDARIVLLKRTIDFYLRSKEATNDIGIMMRRLQVENSLQSVQFVSNELELKDVSSVVASGATIISELQQLQLAQQHGQRSNIVNLNLITSGIRAIIDQLNQDLAHLKTVLNQRRLVLLNEDATKMANNFTSKCHQLHSWLNNQVKSFLLANNRLASDQQQQVRSFCESHDQLRVGVQNKTLEVEALLRSLPTLIENFDTKSGKADEIQRATDELRQDWITVTNCLDRRTDLAKKYLAILSTVSTLDKELDSLDHFNSGRQSTPERTDEDIKSNIDQSLVQLTNQVKNFNLDAQKSNTELVYPAPQLSAGARPTISDINKQQLVEQANRLLDEFTNRKRAVNEQLESKRARNSAIKSDPAHKRPQLVDPPRFTRILSDQTVEPFSTVELECETDDPGYQIEWFMNNFKKIPQAIKHSATSEGNQHRLTISNFSPICCGIYQVRATNSSGYAISKCRLRLSGIREIQDEPASGATSISSPIAANNGATVTTTTTITNRQTDQAIQQQNFQSASPAISTTSSFSQWRPTVASKNASSQSPGGAAAAATTIDDGNTNDKSIARIIQGIGSSEPETEQGTSVKIIGPVIDDADTEVTIQQEAAKTTRQFPATQSTYSGQSGSFSANTTNSNHLRVSYTDSPVSSATLDSRSVSKSPFEGTPQAPVFVQGLTDSMARSCSRAGLVCVVIGNPPPTIEWLHNNTPIATAKCQKTANQRANICKLTIETMNNRTQGQYICRASNRVGRTSTGLTLTK